MTDSERIKAVIDYAKMTTNEFSTSLGWERAMNLYNILNGKTNISVRVCNRICKKYPEINYTWLLTGDGNMLASIHDDTIKPNLPILNNNINSNFELMTPERFDRLLDLMEGQQRTIDKLLKTQNPGKYTGIFLCDKST